MDVVLTGFSGEVADGKGRKEALVFVQAGAGKWMFPLDENGQPQHFLAGNPKTFTTEEDALRFAQEKGWNVVEA